MAGIKDTKTFNEVVKEFENMIYYHIANYRIRDDHDEFYQEGMNALWVAYLKHDDDKGEFAQYAHYKISYRLKDYLRKIIREQEKTSLLLDAQHTEETLTQEMDTLEKTEFQNTIRKILTEKQWKYIYYHIYNKVPLKQIAEMEHTSVDAVKNWGREARKKLKYHPEVIAYRNR